MLRVSSLQDDSNALVNGDRDDAYQKKLVLLLVLCNLFLITGSASNRLVDLIDSPGSSVWCMPHDLAPRFISWCLEAFCGASTFSVFLVPLYIACGALAGCALLTDRTRLLRFFLCVGLGFYFVSSGIASNDHPYGLFLFPVVEHLFILIVVFLIFFRNYSITLLQFSIALAAIFYAPSRFSESWVLGDFLTSGDFSGYRGYPNVIPVITMVALPIGIFCPLLFLSRSLLVRMCSLTLWVASESLVLDVGLGRNPSIVDYSSVMVLLWVIFYVRDSERPYFQIELEESLSPALFLWLLFLLPTLYFSLLRAVDRDAYVKAALPSFHRPDVNYQCLVEASAIDAKYNISDNLKTSPYRFEDFGVYASCQPFAHYRRLLNYCQQHRGIDEMNMTIVVSRNGHPFRREFRGSLQCSRISELLSQRLWKNIGGDTDSSEGYALLNRLIRNKNKKNNRVAVNVSVERE